MDMQKALQYFKTLSELPGEVDVFMQSNLIGDYLDVISKKYSVSQDYLNDLAIEIVIKKFDVKFLDNIVEKIKNDLKVPIEKATLISVDYLGMVILPVSIFLSGIDIRQQIKKLGGDPEKFNIYINSFQDLLEDYVYEELNDIVAENEKHFDIKDEEQVMESMFQNDFKYLLEHPNRDLNAGLISLLFADANFKNVLFKYLQSNQQKIFSHEITVDGKKFIPTFGELINNFISVKGGAQFNNLTLSDYITNSKYTRGIGKDEKDVVIKLLTFYRNLRFFPQTLENISPDKWEIFPLEKTGKTAMESRQTLATPKSPEELEIENLEKMAAGYELGSLERRAVEEEIRKMKLSIKYTNVKR